MGAEVEKETVKYGTYHFGNAGLVIRSGGFQSYSHRSANDGNVIEHRAHHHGRAQGALNSPEVDHQGKGTSVRRVLVADDVSTPEQNIAPVPTRDFSNEKFLVGIIPQFFEVNHVE